MSQFRSSPEVTPKMPGGIPYIIGNEAAERFSFYGMKAALAVFLANYLGVLGGSNLSEAAATSYVSYFNSAVYITPLLGALIADAFFGKYRTIITLSIVYCLGHLCLAFMGVGGVVQFWLLGGLGLIALGAGGIKPCVSAHVGDQFGKQNQHLLTKIFNIFYFAINFGAVISNLLIPWILKWYGPHWAFGIPGVLMAIATLFFWMGRHRFAHIPARGKPFLRELFSKEGLAAILKLLPLVFFVGVFWGLFDQTASSFVFQAMRMDRMIFGIELLPSQVQAFNPFLILILIPVFTYLVYPLVGRVIRLTPLRKIGTGLAIMVLAWVVISFAQEAIDRGETPHIGWQLLSYFILTAAEVMISIVGLEFFYTQAPRKMKSFLMAIFLTSVSFGNLFTGLVNDYIQTPSVVVSEAGHPGFDGQSVTEDDLSLIDGSVVSPATPALNEAVALVRDRYEETQSLPLEIAVLPTDPWGNPLRYTLLSAGEARITSDGPDRESKTQWDLGAHLALREDGADLEGTWLHEEKIRRGLQPETVDPEASPLTVRYSAGGGVTLEGAAYFWFFTKLMLGTALLFIPFAVLYKPRNYLHGDEDSEAGQFRKDESGR